VKFYFSFALLTFRCANLETLILASVQSISDCGLEMVAKGCTKLRRIDLAYNKNVKGEIFRLVPRIYFPELELANFYLGIEVSEF